jgi:hypothetical protein
MKKKVPVMLLDQNNKWHDKKEIVLAGTYYYRQCYGSGSAWIRINFGQIRIGNTDPDPGGQK